MLFKKYQKKSWQQNTQSKQQKGRQAEEQVIEALRKQGFNTHARRSKVFGIEIDLICFNEQKHQAWIVEVKTCLENFEHFISKSQKQRQKLALQVCIDRFPQYQWRAVLALVYPHKIEWVFDYLIDF